MLRRACVLLLTVLLLPAAPASEGGVELVDSVGETTVLPGTSGLLLVGTTCGRTDLVGGTLAPVEGNVSVELRLRNLGEACPKESEWQAYEFTMAYESEGELQRIVAEVHAYQGEVWSGTWWTLYTCHQHWLVVFEQCDDDIWGSATVDVATSTVRFTAPIPWEDAQDAFFTSAMGRCMYGCPDRVYEAEPADRMPDPPTTVEPPGAPSP